MRTTYKKWPLVAVAALAFGALSPAVVTASPAAAASVATATPAAGVQWPDRIERGERLLAGEELVSQNGGYRLLLTLDGVAEIRTPTGGALWRTKAAGAGAYMTVKSDGKLVLYSRGGHPVWYNGVQGAEPVAVIQDTGHLVQYLGEDAAWHTERKAFGPDLTFPDVDEGSSSPTPPDDDPEPTPPATTGKRTAALHPFSSSSVWNSAIGSGADFQGRYEARTSSFLSGKPVINRSSWSIVVKRAKSTDPMAKLVGVRNGESWNIRIPSNTSPTSGSDGHVTIIAPDGVTAYDAYKLTKQSDTHYTAALVVITDLRSNGLVSGVRAAGVPAVAGLIRSHELDSGQIPHALAVALPPEMLKRGHVWPANRQDSDASSYSGSVPMGALLAIPGSVNLGSMGLSVEGMALGKALQDYGAYVVDRSGMVSLYCELSCDADKTGRMATAWRELYPLMRAVSNSSPSSVGGGGVPRVADPAPLP